MSKTSIETGNQGLDGDAAGAAGARSRAQPLGSAADPAIHDLMADVQDLLTQLAHVADPDIARLRTRVTGALASAETAVTDAAKRIQRRTSEAANVGQAYVRNQPWQVIGVAAVVGLVAGIFLARR